MAGIKISPTNPLKPSGGGGSGGSGFAIVEAVTSAAKAIINALKNSFRVLLPENHFSPDGADTIDIRVIGIIDAGATEILMSYTAIESQTVRFIRYATFTNIVLANNVEFFPTKKSGGSAGSRILRYHGDPQDNFKMNSSVGPDLTENSMIPCDITLRAGETIEWKVFNGSLVKSDIAVRMRGYIVTENKNGQRGFGG